jgi:hypothetical protein
MKNHDNVEMNMMSHIEVKPSPTADTRSCDPKTVSKEQLLESSQKHIKDVTNAINWLANELMTRRPGYDYDGYFINEHHHHDHDKLSDIDGFHRDFIRANESPFIDGEWYKKHLKVNRHHLNTPDGIPDDVNLIDVLEHIADCATAGMARSGSVFPIELADELLQKAVKNTLELMISKIIVVEDASSTNHKS